MDKPSNRLREFPTLVRKRFRAWLRVLHRDAGYLAVGLTFVYALSGLAINHIGSFDPNFKDQVKVVALKAPLPADQAAAEKAILSQLGITDTPRDVYAEGNTVELKFDRREIIADRTAGTITDKAQEPRFFLRVANWLHYNRGKAAWTYVADGYAIFLLFLAISGPLLLKGKNGLVGRGAILIALGAAIPILYVHFSGGPH